MKTTQTAIARLESGRQSPSLLTLLAYAHANGYCLELGFVRHSDEAASGCVIRVEDPALEQAAPPSDLALKEPSV